jgi:hypothetical protein
MLNRLSVNLILKAVIGTLGTIVVVVLALGAWNSWTRLRTADRIARSSKSRAIFSRRSTISESTARRPYGP